jgi:hypothetical protein
MHKTFKLPNMEHDFDLQIVGEETGINWVGKFKYKRPTLTERSLIHVMAARLNGDLRTVDPDITTFNEAVAHLRWTLKEFPDWWRDADYGGMLYDGNVVIEIYNKCIEFEASWREKVHGGKQADVTIGGAPNADKAISRPTAGAAQ